MEVTLFRHGIAVDRADPLAPVDFDRPLTLDGKNKIELAARGLRALDLRPTLVLSSPFRRCVQSARLIAQGLGLAKKSVLESENLAPDADPRDLWPELARHAQAAVLCVGHGGALEPVAGVALGLPTRLPGETPEAAPQVDLAYRTLHIKKAGALHLEVTFEPELSAQLAWFLSPRILRQLGRS